MKLCSACDGSGLGRYEDTRCLTCRGTGTARKDDAEERYYWEDKRWREEQGK